MPDSPTVELLVIGPARSRSTAISQHLLETGGYDVGIHEPLLGFRGFDVTEKMKDISALCGFETSPPKALVKAMASEYASILENDFLQAKKILFITRDPYRLLLSRLKSLVPEGSERKDGTNKSETEAILEEIQGISNLVKICQIKDIPYDVVDADAFSPSSEPPTQKSYILTYKDKWSIGANSDDIRVEKANNHNYYFFPSRAFRCDPARDRQSVLKELTEKAGKPLNHVDKLLLDKADSIRQNIPAGKTGTMR
jgi:hypothetical protein